MVALVDVAHDDVLQRPEAAVAGHALAALLADEPGVLAAKAGQAGADEPRPARAGVFGPAPDQREGAAWAQHAVDLSRRAIGVEPVPGVPAGHGVHAPLAERQVLGGRGDRFEAGTPELGPHRRGRLHRHDVVPRGRERAREQARARAEVEDDAAGGQAQRGDELGRVRRPAAVVDAGRRLREELAAPRGVAQRGTASQRRRPTRRMRPSRWA